MTPAEWEDEATLDEQVDSCGQCGEELEPIDFLHGSCPSCGETCHD